MRCAILLAAALALPAWGATTATQTSEALATNAGIDNGVSSQSTANTWVFPAPVQPGQVAVAKCVNGGVQSVALAWNLISWSTPKHELVLGCQVAADLEMLTRACQFGSAAQLQSHYLRQQYGLVVPVNPAAADLTPEECFRPKPVAPPPPPPAPVVPPVAPPAPQVAAPPVAQPAPAAKAEPFRASVHFAHKSAKLTAEATSVLEVVGMYVRRHPEARVLLAVGHADSTGSAALNERLAMRRAEAAAQYLQMLGVPRQMILVDQQGSSSPVASNSTAEGRARNRRTEISVIE